MVTGNLLILISFIFLGPIPAFDFIGGHLSLTVFCVGSEIKCQVINYLRPSSH